MLRSSSLVVLALVAGASGCRERNAGGDAAVPRTAPPPRAPAKAVRIIYPAAPGSFVDLASDLRSSVVTIRSTAKVPNGPAAMFPNSEEDYALGSGFIIDRNGHVVTNDHVIAHAREIRVVVADGTELAANVIGRDPKLDIAVLKIDASPKLTPAPLGDSDQLQVGEWVVALGNPFADELTVSAGIVSALGRSSETIVGPTLHTYRSCLQTDAAINAGNSGGPLVNTAGEVIGINNAVDKRGTGVGFALPINRAKRMIPLLVNEGRPTRTWLGVFIHPVTRQVAQERAMASVTGALVSEVIAGSPAAKAGIKAGDVILRFDGRDVNHQNFPWLAATTGVGNQIDVVVWRNQGEIVLNLVSESMPK